MTNLLTLARHWPSTRDEPLLTLSGVTQVTSAGWQQAKRLILVDSNGRHLYCSRWPPSFANGNALEYF